MTTRDDGGATVPIHTFRFKAKQYARSRLDLADVAQRREFEDTPLGYSRDAFLDAALLDELLRRKCIERHVPVDATPLFCAHLRWRAGYAAPDIERCLNETLVLRRADVERCAQLLCVATLRIDPSVEAMRCYAERFGAVPLAAMAGYAYRCGEPLSSAGHTAKRARSTSATTRVARLSDGERYVRNVLFGERLAGSTGHQLYDVLQNSRPVSLEMVAFELQELDNDDERRDSQARREREMCRWRVAVVASRSFQITMRLCGYVSRATVERSAVLIDANHYLLPMRALAASAEAARAELDADEQYGGTSVVSALVDDEAASSESSEAPLAELGLEQEAAAPRHHVAPPVQTPHELDRLEALQLDGLTRYECDRSARDRLSVLLSVCAFYERPDEFERMPNATHVHRYPRGPGAPVRIARANAPGLLARASSEDYAALGLGMLCVAAHAIDELAQWLLYAEALLARQRRSTPAQIDAHVCGVERALARCAEPTDSSALHEIASTLRTLMLDRANLEAAEPTNK